MSFFENISQIFIFFILPVLIKKKLLTTTAAAAATTTRRMHRRTPPGRHELHSRRDIRTLHILVPAGQLQVLGFAHENSTVLEEFHGVQKSKVPVQMFYLSGETRMGTVNNLHHVFTMEIVAVGVQSRCETVQPTFLEGTGSAFNNLA